MSEIFITESGIFFEKVSSDAQVFRYGCVLELIWEQKADVRFFGESERLNIGF